MTNLLRNLTIVKSGGIAKHNKTLSDGDKKKLSFCREFFLILFTYLIFACAAANLAIGTLNGEQET